MWAQANTKLIAGPHSLSREEVEQVQRERLLAAVTEVVAELGYQETTVRKLIAQAGVSRRTYYDLFADKEECFLTAYDEIVGHVLTRMRDAAPAEAEPAERLRGALRELLEFCADEPAAARACIVEILAAGPAGRDRRARTMKAMAALAETALADVHDDPDLAALSAQSLVGSVHELIYAPVDRGEVERLPELVDTIVALQLGSPVPA